MPNRSQRRRRVLIAIAAAIPISLLLAPTLVGPHLVRTRGLASLERKLGRKVTAGAISVRWGKVELHDFAVDGEGAAAPIAVPQVTARFAIAPVFGGHVEVTSVELERPQITVLRGATGDDNVSSILAKLRARKESATAASESRVSGPRSVEIHDGVLHVDDDDLGTVDIKRLSAALRPGGPCHAELDDVDAVLAAGPAAGASKLLVDFQLDGTHLAGLPAITVEGGRIKVWKGFSLSGVTGGVTPDPADATRSVVDLRGGYGGVDRVLWDAKGWIQPDARRGEVALNAARFDLAQLKPILAGTPVVDPEQANVDASLRLVYKGDPADATHRDDSVAFTGRFHMAGLSVFHAMLGPLPVRDLGFDATVDGWLKPKERVLRIERAQFDYRGLRAILTAHAEKLGKKPAFDAWLQIAPVPCQTALAALPVELTPALQGFKMQGTFKTELHLAIDLSDLTQGVDLGGTVGIDGCRVLEAPEPVAIDRLAGSFEQAVEVVPGEWQSFIVGPDNPDWVPYDQISPHLINSIMTTEDSGFMKHRGFIPSEFRSALQQNLERGYFRLGASSITMQMVKNVLLSREKTLSRKLQELFLTWYVENNLTKERILEIYFNVIEFGPGIYGIGRAARHYFGKPAKDLQPREAVWFSSILPNPKRRYVHYCKGAPDTKWELYLNRILKRMHERGRLTDEQYDQALAAHLVFDRAEALPERECLDMIKRITTPVAGVASAKAGDGEEEQAEDNDN